MADMLPPPPNSGDRPGLDFGHNTEHVVKGAITGAAIAAFLIPRGLPRETYDKIIRGQVIGIIILVALFCFGVFVWAPRLQAADDAKQAEFNACLNLYNEVNNSSGPDQANVALDQCMKAFDAKYYGGK